MRLVAAVLVFWCALAAQFRSTVPLVVAPTTVTDSNGRYVDGLAAGDLVLYDNNVPQPIHLDAVLHPISLVVLVQASSHAAAALDKLGRSGILFSQLLAGEGGETAVLSFSDGMRLAQDFTGDADLLSRALRNLRVQGDGAATLAAVMEALRLLVSRGEKRRPVLLVIAEKRDRSSKVKPVSVLAEAQRRNVPIYWLTFSPFLTPFTNRPKTAGGRGKEEDRGKDPERDAQPLPPETAPGSLLSIFTELRRRGQPDISAVLTGVTGGRALNFLKQRALEEAIQAVGEEVHRQYLLSFQPAPSAPGVFHAIRVEVKGRPELRARTRAGYWTVE